MHLIRRATCRLHITTADRRARGSPYLYTAALSALLRLENMHDTYKYVPVPSLIYSLLNDLILSYIHSVYFAFLQIFQGLRSNFAPCVIASGTFSEHVNSVSETPESSTRPAPSLAGSF